MPDANGQLAGFSTQDQIEQLIRDHSLLSKWRLEFACRHSASCSDVLEFRRRDDPVAPRLMIKHRNRWMTREESNETVVREFHIVERIWNLADTAFRKTMPRPVTLLPEVGAAVFEAVQGTPMTVLLKREANRLAGPFCRGRMCRMARRCGEWLRAFHALTAGPGVEYDSARYLSKLSYWLEKSQRRGLERMTTTSLWQAANQVCEKSGCLAVTTAGIHGDFVPQNIFVSRDKISVIDFASVTEPEPIYEDIGLFVAYLQLLAGGTPYSRGTIQAMTCAFLLGYGADDRSVLLDLYVLKGIVMIFADQFASGSALGEESGKIRRIKAQLARAPSELLRDRARPHEL
jgi:aminoglycoside phosphotransferase (APT) family kinase protein